MKTNIESFEDIIFENRNKDYGAYELRRRYSKRGILALLISVLIISFAVGVPLIAGMANQNINPRSLDSLVVIDVFNLPDESEIPKVPPPPTVPPLKNIFFGDPKVVNELTDPEIELATFEELSEAANSGDIDTSSRISIPKKIDNYFIEPDDKEHSIIDIKEKPLFPGGDTELLRYIAENTKYPVSAQEANIEGTVYIRFVVSKTGDVDNVTIARSVDPVLDQEALRVVKTIPKWTPGKNNGNPVKVWFIIPVRFKLQF
jgi:periplasmic protein TonB